jgi:hypothetical protein
LWEGVPLSQCKNLKKTDCEDGKRNEILVFLKNPPFLRDYEE